MSISATLQTRAVLNKHRRAFGKASVGVFSDGKNVVLQYRKLMVAQFTPQDHKIIAKGLVKATTPSKAEVLLPQPGDNLLPREQRSKWSMRSVSLIGNADVWVLLYKGLEVAVFFRRQTSLITPEPGDPIPEGYLQHADDVWARMDLFSKSPRQLVGSVREELAEKDREIQRLTIEVETQSHLLKTQAKQLEQLRRQLKDAQSQPAKAKSNRKR